MIWDSSYWKDDLLRRAALLRKRMQQKRWTEASHARLEQTIMLGFYSIRKLIEAKKLSNALIDQQIQVVDFPSLGKPITHLNWHKFDKLYDQDSSLSLHKPLVFLCNQFVHSYVFMPIFDDKKRLSHVIVASDFERNHFSYEVDLNRVIDLFEQIGADYPCSARYTFNPKTNDYDVWQGI